MIALIHQVGYQRNDTAASGAERCERLHDAVRHDAGMHDQFGDHDLLLDAVVVFLRRVEIKTKAAAFQFLDCSQTGAKCVLDRNNFHQSTHHSPPSLEWFQLQRVEASNCNPQFLASGEKNPLHARVGRLSRAAVTRQSSACSHVRALRVRSQQMMLRNSASSSIDIVISSSVQLRMSGAVPCMELYRSKSTGRAKSNDVYVRALTKLSVRRNSSVFARSYGQTTRQPASRLSLEKMSAPALAGLPANSRRLRSSTLTFRWSLPSPKADRRAA